MGCCGRPAQRQSNNKNQDYYSRYAYLSSSQRAKQVQATGSMCSTCSALTTGDPCTICGQKKVKEEEAS